MKKRNQGNSWTILIVVWTWLLELRTFKLHWGKPFQYECKLISTKLGKPNLRRTKRCAVQDQSNKPTSKTNHRWCKVQDQSKKSKPSNRSQIKDRNLVWSLPLTKSKESTQSYNRYRPHQQVCKVFSFNSNISKRKQLYTISRIRMIKALFLVKSCKVKGPNRVVKTRIRK